MGSWEMFVIPQKLFFFTGTRLLGVNTPVPDLPSIFTTPAPVSGRLREPAFVYILRPGTLLITVADIPFLVHPPTCTQMLLHASEHCALAFPILALCALALPWLALRAPAVLLYLLVL